MLDLLNKKAYQFFNEYKHIKVVVIMEQVFTEVYENKIWGDNQTEAYQGSSGGGSSIEYNETTYVPFLKKFIVDKGIQTVVDVGCGDFQCGKLIYDDLDVTYTGYDAYSKVVEYNASRFPSPKYSFHHLDVYGNKERLPSGDLCILKDVLQHWPLENIYMFLDYVVQGKFKYILICNCSNQFMDNTTTPLGGFNPLSCDYLPLKKYNPIKLYTYHTKEISLLEMKKTIEQELEEIRKEIHDLKIEIKKLSSHT
jgi:hypothetical protein